MKTKVRWKMIMMILLLVIIIIILLNYNDFIEGFKEGYGR